MRAHQLARRIAGVSFTAVARGELMMGVRQMSRFAVAIAAALGFVCAFAAEALASVTPGWECVPAAAGQAVVSGGTGSDPSCGAGTTAVLAPTYVPSGVGGKPTVQFAQVNVQIVSGIGVDRRRGERRGEPCDRVRGERQRILACRFARSRGRAQQRLEGLRGDRRRQQESFSSIAGGCDNVTGTAALPSSNCNRFSFNGEQAILGGIQNRASARADSVSGGAFNTAGGGHASVSGGESNTASAIGASVLGGSFNGASSNCESIPAIPNNSC
jgi:hypothetical protein